MALFSLARSRQLPMVATFIVQLGALLLACSGLAEGQSRIHVSLRITKRDPPPSRVDEFPYRLCSSHRFGRTAASPQEEYYHRPIFGGGAHVNLRLTVKLPVQTPADASAAADNFARVQRNNIIRRCQYRSPHHEAPHRYKFSFPGEERIPFGNINEEIENHVTRNSAMQNVFETLASAGLRADQVELISPTAEDRYYENSGSCSCGHDHARASTVSPQEISIPFDPFFTTSPSDAVPHDHDQARYGNQFHAYDHQNCGSNDVGFMTFRDDGWAREGFSFPTITGLQEQNTGHDGARHGVHRMSERAAEKEPRREEFTNKFEPVYKKKQPKHHMISFV